MNEAERLLTALKRELRARGLTYRDVAKALRLSEASVKRLFSSGGFSLRRLTALTAWLNLSLSELARLAALDDPRLRKLTPRQEAELVSDLKLLLVAVCTLNHWSAADIVRTYRVSETQCLQRLLRLDRMRIIDLMPGNRVRLNVARDFDWLPNGPFRRFFREQGEKDFLAGDFAGNGETLAFVHAMLTAASASQMRARLDRLRQEFADLHEQSLAAPLAQRSGTGLLLALRGWEPQLFAAFRRKS